MAFIALAVAGWLWSLYAPTDDTFDNDEGRGD
jgi:hypothetical protein